MGITNIINLLGGLGLFLFGMKYMSEAINQVAGNKMKNLLEKLTRNRFKGFFWAFLLRRLFSHLRLPPLCLWAFLTQASIIAPPIKRVRFIV